MGLLKNTLKDVGDLAGDNKSIFPIIYSLSGQYPAACGGRKGSGLAPRLIPFIGDGTQRNRCRL